MGNQTNKNAAAKKVAALQTAYDEAVKGLEALEVSAEVRAEAQVKIDEATAVFNALPETATDEEKATAQKAIDEAVEAFNALVVDPGVKEEAQEKLNKAKEALDAELAKLNAKPAEKGKTRKVKFLVSPTGKFNLAYNVSEEASLPEPQAIELEELGYVKFVD